MRYYIFIFLLLNNLALAKDLGTEGTTFPIKEESFLNFIMNRLNSYNESGKLAYYQNQLINKTKHYIESPRAISFIQEAKEDRVYYYKPIYKHENDITDNNGNIIYKSGTEINPLNYMNLSKDLLFIDGSNRSHVAFIRTYLEQKRQVKIILVKGSPVSLSEELDQIVYFDQGGKLISKFGIKAFPAVVTQENDNLKINEVKLSGETYAKG